MCVIAILAGKNGGWWKIDINVAVTGSHLVTYLILHPSDPYPTLSHDAGAGD